jgi:hypothetical protein
MEEEEVKRRAGRKKTNDKRILSPLTILSFLILSLSLSLSLSFFLSSLSLLSLSLSSTKEI